MTLSEVEQTTETPQTEGQPAETQTEERTYAGKFKSVEELEKGYTELQKKLGAPREDVSIERNAPTAAVPEVEDALNSAGLTFEDIESSVARNGKPTEDQYKALAKAGLPRGAVDRIVKAETVLRTSIVDAAYNAAGGEENFRQLQQWAASEDSGVTDAEIAAFNAAVTGKSASPDLAKAQVGYLLYRYQNSQPDTPEPMVRGQAAPSGGGGFKSYEEKQKAGMAVYAGRMSQEEYDRRLAATPAQHRHPAGSKRR